MERITWQDSYSVHNDILDGHHKKLFQLFDEIYDILEGGDAETPTYSPLKVISELNVYALFHFKEEEKLMEEIQFSELDAHRKQHEYFIEKIHEFKKQYKANDTLINYDLYYFLSHWLIQHIIQVDSKYMDYI